MHEVYNFSAGPAVLPHQVLRTVQNELLDWRGSGLSVLEVSHRGDIFAQIIAEAEQDCRSLLGIPAHYKVLFLQGGAHTQFAMVPLNLLPEHASADYVDTGHWSRMAIEEASRYGKVNVVASAQAHKDNRVPVEQSWQKDDTAAYLHYTSNETISGVQFPFIPASEVPLVADMSSDFMSKPIDINRFGLIYAGAQKNIGPAGLTMVVIAQSLLERGSERIPTMLNYKTLANSGSLYNTPPTFAIYVAGLVFKWLKEQGGLTAIAAYNQKKSCLLYDVIDQNQGFYEGTADRHYRSQMNVTFSLANQTLLPLFLREATAQQLLHLKGHRLLGGVRASIYNAMPLEGVQVLADFMRGFVRRYG